MPSFLQKSLIYLGLVDEERLTDDPADSESAVGRGPSPALRRAQDPVRGVQGRRVEPPLGRREVGDSRVAPHSGASRGSVRAVPPGDAHAETLKVREFGDAKLIADRLRERTPVVMNLRETDPDMVRRIVDFCSGLTYSLDGSMRKISEGVVLVLPPRVGLSRDEKQRLTDQGLYTIDDETF